MDPVSLLQPAVSHGSGKGSGGSGGNIKWDQVAGHLAVQCSPCEGISFTDINHPFLQCVPKLYSHAHDATVKCYNWICVYRVVFKKVN